MPVKCCAWEHQWTVKKVVNAFSYSPFIVHFFLLPIDSRVIRNWNFFKTLGFDFVFKLCRICLRSIGAWPELYQSPVGKVLTEFHYFANLFILIFFVNFMQTVQLINCWGDIDVMTNVLSTADLPIANVTCMMIKFWFKRQGMFGIIWKKKPL